MERLYISSAQSQEKGQLAEAEVLGVEGRRHLPDKAEVLIHQAQPWQELGKLNEAVAILSATALSPRDATAAAGLGMANMRWENGGWASQYSSSLPSRSRRTSI